MTSEFEARLAQLDAGRLLASLAMAQPPQVIADVLADVTRPGLPGSPLHYLLARLLVRTPYLDLRDSLELAGAASADVWSAILGRWLWTTAIAVVRLPVRLTAPPPPAELDAAPLGLRIDERLSDPPLPLRPFAEDVARGQPAGRLVVLSRALVGCRGLYEPCADAGVVWLDVDRLPTAQERSWTWAHELGHAVDVLGVTGAHVEEEWADRVAALLLERQPRSVAEIQPELERIGAERSARVAAGGSNDAVEEMLDVSRFLALPIVLTGPVADACR